MNLSVAAKDTSPGNASFLMISWVRREYINKWDDSSEDDLLRVRHTLSIKWKKGLTQRRDTVSVAPSPPPAPDEGWAVERRV